MGIFLVRAVLNAIPSVNIAYDISVSAAEIDEGGLVDITITRNLNGLPHQDSSVKFRTLNATEFDDEFPGETQALASDFTEGYGDTSSSPLRVACAAAGIDVIHVGGQYDQLIWTALSQDSVTFRRHASNHPDDQGDKISAYILTDPSVGAVADPIASFGILSDFVAPSTLQIADVGLVYTLRRTTASAGEVVCWIEASAGAIAADGVSLNSDADGKFAVGAPVAGRYPIITTSVACDFEGLPVGSSAQTRGVSHETISVRALGTAAETIDLSINIWPELPLIEVTGDETGNNQDLTTASAINSALHSSVSNRTLSIPDPGIYKLPSTGVRNDDRSNATWRGVRGVVLRVGRGPEIRKGSNKLYKNISFRAGAHFVTEVGGDPSNVDNLVGGLSPDTRLEMVKFENCSFSLSWDELLSIIQAQGSGQYPRGIWFERCLFHSPLIDIRDGIPHHYGPIVAYEFCGWVVVNKCVFASCAMRSPFVGKSRWVSLRNNVIYYRSTNVSGHSAITIKADNSVQNNQDISLDIRGNLLKCEEGLNQTDGRSVAIGAQALGTGSYINAHFDDPPYENHFFQHAVGTPLFADDPLVLATHVKKHVGTTDAALASSFVDFDPFIGPDYDYWPTDTESARQALWEDVRGYAGNRARAGDPYDGPLVFGDSALDRFDYALWQGPGLTLLTDGKRSGPLHASVDAAYGTAWDGVGGSLGYAMNAVPP